jgi:hypothetical protein
VSKRKADRLQRLERAIAALPVRDEIVQQSFGHFCQTGELPELERLAAAVVDRALQRKEEPEPLDLESLDAFTAELRKSNIDLNAALKTPSARQRLFQEAVHGYEVVRLAARECLKLVVACGFDVTDPRLLAEEPVPESGSVALYLLRFPDDLARPPFVRQTRRLLARFADLWASIDPNDAAWFERLAAALRAFHHEDTLPEDDLLLEFALAFGELLALTSHRRGKGDAELIVAFDAVARAKPGERAAALAKLREMLRAGRLLAE